MRRWVERVKYAVKGWLREVFGPEADAQPAATAEPWLVEAEAALHDAAGESVLLLARARQAGRDAEMATAKAQALDAAVDEALRHNHEAVARDRLIEAERWRRRASQHQARATALSEAGQQLQQAAGRLSAKLEDLRGGPLDLAHDEAQAQALAWMSSLHNAQGQAMQVADDSLAQQASEAARRLERQVAEAELKAKEAGHDGTNG